ncbi:MAG: DUF799 family lipoprotein [Nitrospirae bacterium]|nr:DUF799 family lipoprotein [Nitrospirota bacterium]
MREKNIFKIILLLFIVFLMSCATAKDTSYHDPNMDFAAIKTVAVMPFENFSRDNLAADRVRDVFINMLLSTGEVYVIPTGEVSRGVVLVGITNPSAPSAEEIVKFTGIVKADAVITGAVKEYETVRSGTTSANVISMSLIMLEARTGKIVWTASSTKGGINTLDRLFGGGGEPMNDITEKAVNELINTFFK